MQHNEKTKLHHNASGCATAQTESLRNSALVARIKNHLCERIPMLFARADTDSSYRWAWIWGYLGRAASALYCATGDQEILQLIVSSHAWLLVRRDDNNGRVDEVRKRTMKAWSTHLPGERGRGRWACEVEVTGLTLLPFTDLLLRADTLAAALPVDFRHAVRRMIVDGLESHLNELVYDSISGGGYFTSPWDDAVEPLNHSHLFAAAATEAFILEDDTRFQYLADQVYTYFRAYWFEEDNGTVAWAYCPTPGFSKMAHAKMRYGQIGFDQKIGAEYFYKSGVTIELPIALYRNRLIEKTDLERISQSLFKNIFLLNSKINFYISPRKIHMCEDILNSPIIIRPQHVLSFDLLSSVHPVASDILDDFLAMRTDLFPKGWFSSAVGVFVLTRRLCQYALS